MIADERKTLISSLWSFVSSKSAFRLAKVLLLSSGGQPTRRQSMWSPSRPMIKRIWWKRRLRWRFIVKLTHCRTSGIPILWNYMRLWTSALRSIWLWSAAAVALSSITSRSSQISAYPKSLVSTYSSSWLEELLTCTTKATLTGTSNLTTF